MVSPALPEDLSSLLRHLEAAYPLEGCGLIFRGPSGFRIHPMRNAYDAYAAVDPARFPRTARTAYFFDPREWLKVSQAAEEGGEEIACIFHSHVDVGAYFSTEDKAMAAPEGQPLFPQVSYLVVAVDQGRATAARLFWWKEDTFADREVVL